MIVFNKIISSPGFIFTTKPLGIVMSSEIIVLEFFKYKVKPDNIHDKDCYCSKDIKLQPFLLISSNNHKIVFKNIHFRSFKLHLVSLLDQFT